MHITSLCTVSLPHYKLGIGTLLSSFCPSLVPQFEFKTTMFILLYDSISQVFEIIREICFGLGESVKITSRRIFRENRKKHIRFKPLF
jgi:hypothetical protein